MNDTQYAEVCVVIQWGTFAPETKSRRWKLCHISMILKQNNLIVPLEKITSCNFPKIPCLYVTQSLL